MYSASSVHAANNPAPNTVATAPRLFNRLDDTSKERVTLLLSRVQALLPVEREAFMQELQRQLADEEQAVAASNSTRTKLVRYTGPNLVAVQARDRGYVVPRALAAGGEPHAGKRAPAPSRSLEELVCTPGMFGEEEVAVHLEKMSLYDKLHQNMADGQDASSEAEQRRGSALDQRSPTQSESEPQTAEVRGGTAASSDVAGPRSRGPYRSNAYQAVRLAMTSPGFIAAQKPSSMADTQTGHDGVQSAVNTTGIPISDEDLREWFDELDEEGRGALSLDEFQNYMQSLERDFGVSDEYAALQRAGERLAFDGRLSFEAFAYLVLRFARV